MIASKGDRVKVLRFAVSEPGGFDDNEVVPPGTEGTVEEVSKPTSITPRGQIWVAWDNGHRLSLLPDQDQFVVLN